MFAIPKFPMSTDATVGSRPLQLRYEDLCQDGRLVTQVMPHAIGALWQSCLGTFPFIDLRHQGIFPILSHLWISGTQQPIHLLKPIRCEGKGILAHTKASNGETNRLILDIEVSILGTAGRMHGQTPINDGDEALAGRVYARHVFTNPFAPAGKRRLLRFNHKDFPSVPDNEVQWIDFDSIIALPKNAAEKEESLYTQKKTIHFGMHHSDSNQHVNSLVYPRVFEDEARNRFSQHLSPHLLSRDVVLAFQRPFFVGQQSSLCLQPFEVDSQTGVRGIFSSYKTKEVNTKPHCYVYMNFR